MDRAQRLGRAAERLTATNNRGRVTPQSGSGRTVKNDVRNGEWSFEVKSTSGKTYSISRDVLDAATQHALADGRRMALVVHFNAPRTAPGRARRFVVTSEDDFLEREQELERWRADYERRRIV